MYGMSIGGSCHLRALSNTITGRNEGRIPETSQQIQLQLQCDDQTCLMSDYYNTSCGNDTALAQTLGNQVFFWAIDEHDISE